MQLIASCDLYNPQDYGRVHAGQVFTARESIAVDLVKRGLATAYQTAEPVHGTGPAMPAKDPAELEREFLELVRAENKLSRRRRTEK